jgi:hypothetical protein
VTALPETKLQPAANAPGLTLGYRDPFLDRKGIRRETALAIPAAPKPFVSLVKAKPLINYPKVKYLGGVASDDGRITGAMQVGSAFYQVRQGDTVANVYVIALSLGEGKVQFEDSVWVVRK